MPRAAMGGSRRPWATVGAVVLLAVPLASQQTGRQITSYGFAISLPDTGSTIVAVARLGLRPGDGGDTLRLDLVGLSVDSILPVRSFAYDGRELRIPLTAEAHRRGQISIFYHGVPRDGLIIGVDAHGHRAAFGDNWPTRARYWLPSADAPDAKAPLAFDVRAPRGWKVVANGRLLGQPDSATGLDQWRWVERRPIPTYTMVIGAAEFTVSRHRPVTHGRDSDPIPIEVWAYPADSAFADSVPFRRATEIVEVMERLVGPFPYEKLAHVESSTRFGGMENSSAIFYAEQPLVERRMRESVVRHETAHQWFGDAVTERDWHHLWLSEGFATYLDVVIGAALDGDSVLEAGMQGYAASYTRSEVVDRPIIDTAEHDLLRLLNANNYQKGAWVLHMLRSAVGDSAFWHGMRDYYRAYRDSNALSLDFEHVMERASGRDLAWFFGQWLFQPGYPQLECGWHAAPSGTHVAVTLREIQPGAWGVFLLPQVTLQFTGPDGERARRLVALGGRDTVATFDLAFVPRALQLDPDHRLLLTAAVKQN